jgi:hypothetical protein
VLAQKLETLLVFQRRPRTKRGPQVHVNKHLAQRIPVRRDNTCNGKNGLILPNLKFSNLAQGPRSVNTCIGKKGLILSHLKFFICWLQARASLQETPFDRCIIRFEYTSENDDLLAAICVKDPLPDVNEDRVTVDIAANCVP